MHVYDVIGKEPYPPQENHENEHVGSHENIDKRYLLLSSIWGGTNGIIINQVFNDRLFWIIRFSPLISSINWMIFPFKPNEGLFGQVLSTKEKTYRIASYVLSYLV